jgi:hypothetical protein
MPTITGDSEITAFELLLVEPIQKVLVAKEEFYTGLSFTI